MKIKSGFAKRNIAGSEIVVPVGNKAMEFNGMITLNESGGFFWDCLVEGCTKEQLLSKVLLEYEVTEQKASEDIDKFLDMLRENNLLEE